MERNRWKDGEGRRASRMERRDQDEEGRGRDE